MSLLAFSGNTVLKDLVVVSILTFFAGIAMPLGASFAKIERIKPDWLEKEFRHSVIAFGGGALLAAVSLVLVPEGIEALSMTAAAVCFMAGGIAFMGLDYILWKIDRPASQLLAMLSDFIPESIALGAAFAMGGESGFLLAALIALQNFPESFNAFREIIGKSPYTPRQIVVAFAAMSLLGPFAGITGYLWLSDYPTAVAAIMLLASGGILYSVFQDIAPQAKLERHWAPPFGAVLGFCFGIAGHMLIIS